MKAVVRSNLIKYLAISAATLLVCGFTLLFGAQTACADAKAATDINEGGLKLIVPNSYEQYLNLTAPLDACFEDGRHAICDGNVIYYYEAESAKYKAYTHTANVDASNNVITNVGFLDDDRLLFTDNTTTLRSLNLTDLTATDYALSCSAFILYNGRLVYSNTSGGTTTVSSVSTNDINSTSAVALCQPFSSSNPSVFAVYGDALYYTKDCDLYKYDAENTDGVIVKQALSATAPTSIEIYDGCAYYSVTGGEFYINNLAQAQSAVQICGGIKSAVKSDEMLYLVGGSSVKRFSLTDSAFTDYEICSASDSTNRLNGALDLSLYDNLLCVADTANNRISVFNVDDGTVKTISTAITPKLICAGENKALVSDGARVYVYTLSSGEGVRLELDDGVQVKCATYVYGTFYFAASSNYFYKVDGTRVTSTVKNIEGRTPYLMSSDIYGNIYVAFITTTSRFAVYSYTEQQFCGDYQGSFVYTFENQITRLNVDYDKRLYAMSPEGNVLDSAGNSYTINAEKVVYNSAARAVSFTFGFEKADVYLLCGNLVLATNAIPVSTLSTIDVENSDEAIFNGTTAALSGVSIRTGATVVEFDVDNFAGATTFPYTKYYRLTGELNAAILGSIESYNIIAVYDSSAHKYNAALAVKTDCTALPLAEITSEQTSFTSSVAYTTNEVYLYKYPVLNALLTVKSEAESVRLKKSQTVTVLNSTDVSDGFTAYYKVECSVDGTVTVGYIPAMYLAAALTEKTEYKAAAYYYLNDETLFTSTDLSVVTVPAETQILAFFDENGYVARYTENGKNYYANLTERQLASPSENGLKILYLTLLGITAAAVVVCYVTYLRTKRR